MGLVVHSPATELGRHARESVFRLAEQISGYKVAQMWSALYHRMICDVSGSHLLSFFFAWRCSMSTLKVEGTWGYEEAANYVGCTASTLKVWTSKRRVPHVKVGRPTRFRKSDLDKWLDENVVLPSQEVHS